MGLINHVITGGAPTCMGIETLIGDLRHVRSTGLTESPGAPKKPVLTGPTEAGERHGRNDQSWIKHQFWHVYNGNMSHGIHGFNMI